MWHQLKCYVYFLLLARYVPNVAKSRPIWDQCKKKYILRTDWPTGDQRPTTDRPTNDLTFGKFQMAISPRAVVRSTSCLVLRWGFRGRRIEWRYFRFRQINIAAQPPSWKIQIAISPQCIIRFTLCLVLGRGFRGRRIEWRYFQFRQMTISPRRIIRFTLFGSRMGFSVSADRMAQIPVWPNSIGMWEKTRRKE